MKIVSTIKWKDYQIPKDIFEADFKEALPKMKIRSYADLDPEITKLALETLAKIEAPIMDTAQSKEFINSLRNACYTLNENPKQRYDLDIGVFVEGIKQIVEKRKNEVPFNLNTKTVEHETNIDNHIYDLLVKLDPMND